jgi:GAF domain-containing protein
VSCVRRCEAHSEGLCSIFLLEEDGLHLRYAAAPNLPEAYWSVTDGIRIGPHAGSCGAAAYLRKPVFISDILTRPNWADFRDSVPHDGMRAAWSTPILSHDGAVLGTFCMYYRDVRQPSPAEIHRERSREHSLSRETTPLVYRDLRAACELQFATLSTREHGVRRAS